MLVFSPSNMMLFLVRSHALHHTHGPNRCPERKVNTRLLPELSIVVPALDAANYLPASLGAVAGAEDILVVDGGSRDATAMLARGLGARVMDAPRGRGQQLAAGIAATGGDWLLLLHADTNLGPGWQEAAQTFMDRPDSRDRAAYFRFALDSAHPWARRLERAVAWRSRVLGLPYGDQGLLIGHEFLTRVGGVRPLPLMEDVDLVRRIGRHRLVALDVPAVTSAARWERDGWRRRSARNLGCLALYYLGVPPDKLARFYYR
jgi:rSAM/selenodomain-associated transferase 2